MIANSAATGAAAAVGVRQPEVQRQQGRLDAEHDDQQQRRRAHQRRLLGTEHCHPLRQVRHVQRAGDSVQQRDGDQEQGGAGQVEADVMDRRLQPRRAATVQQQTVRRDQQHLEEHEEVEEVRGEEGSVQPHQLELEECVVVRPLGVMRAASPAPPRVKHACDGDDSGQHEHQGRQTIQRQRDPERRLPVAEQIGVHRARRGNTGQVQRHPEQERRRADRQRARQVWSSLLEQQADRAGHQRQHDWNDDPVRPVHAPSSRMRGSWPST
jgi:hypothetical protein